METYQATAEDWEQIREWAGKPFNPMSRVCLYLLSRVEALEALTSLLAAAQAAQRARIEALEVAPGIAHRIVTAAQGNEELMRQVRESMVLEHGPAPSPAAETTEEPEAVVLVNKLDVWWNNLPNLMKLAVYQQAQE